MKIRINSLLQTTYLICFSALIVIVVMNYQESRKWVVLLSNNINESSENLTEKINELNGTNNQKFSDLDEKIILFESQYIESVFTLTEELTRLKEMINDNNKIINNNTDSTNLINRKIEQIQLILNNELNQTAIDEVESDELLEKVFGDGFILFQEKRYLDSLRIFKEANSIYPYDREIKYYYLASLYYSSPQNRNNYPYLKEQFELLTHDLQYSEKSLNILADISLSENDLEKAFTLYKKLYEMSETNLEYLKSLGMIQYQLGLFPAAHKSFQSYLYTYPEDYEVLYFDGISLYGQGFYKDALKQFYLVQKSDTPYGNIENKIRETTEQLENL